MTDHQNDHNRALENVLMSSKSQVEVVIVPLPAQGHLNQLLHLSRLIAAFDIPVHYVAAATHLRQATDRVHGWNPNNPPKNLHFHAVAVPPFPSPPPDPAGPHPFPSHLLPSVKAAARHLRRPLGELLRDLSSRSRRVAVIHDSLMASAVQDVASIPNAEAYTFHTVSAFAVFLFFWEILGMPLREEANKHVPHNVPSLQGCFPDEFMDFIDEQFQFHTLSSGNLLNASRVIEQPYLDLMDRILEDKRSWAIGPFNPVEIKVSNDKHKCLEWLDNQAMNSVIYVSFGTSTTFTNQQIGELALGLEQSRQKFIWVLRDADRGDVFDDQDQDVMREIELPRGFEERVSGVGVLVRDWAPQMEILGHPATGGFLSHCGWNSCMESFTMGVPIGAWPMHSDQPRNTALVTEVLKVGTVVREWAHRDKLAPAARVAVGVVRLMASEEGREARRRVEELGAAVRRSVVEHGGVARMELNSFIAHISRNI